MLRETLQEHRLRKVRPGTGGQDWKGSLSSAEAYGVDGSEELLPLGGIVCLDA